MFTPTSNTLKHPARCLVLLFAIWKSLLLLIAILSPGPGYDTSTSLAQPIHVSTVFESAIAHLCNKLTRWDALYFIKSANRGYLYEQEWAFGWGMTRSIALCVNGLYRLGVPQLDYMESLVGAVMAHITHLISVLVLYRLTLKVFVGKTRFKIAFLSACLHIFSPGGLFLSAPNAESPFAMLSIVGYYLFAQSITLAGSKSDLSLVGAGLVFGISNTFRSNGLLNGFLFVDAAVRTLLSFQDGFSFARIQRLVAIGIGGCCVGVGFLLPQVIAYNQLCAEASRPWCHHLIPSVYTFVQAHYWNVGFLRYWTVSNLPLFLLAAPMLTILTLSSQWALQASTSNPNDKITTKKAGGTPVPKSKILSTNLIQTMAAIQLLLTVSAFTSYHVQIITRISSAYPVWYWFLASSLNQESSMPGILTKQRAKWTIRWMIMYAVIQGGLYASFLPPA